MSGDEFDREEELRGYNRAIDFTLHTIIEESGEDSEPDLRASRPTDRKRYQHSPHSSLYSTHSSSCLFTLSSVVRQTPNFIGHTA